MQACDVNTFTGVSALVAGYHLISDEPFRNADDDIYGRYHSIMCEQIEKNNILCVNGMIRWIDLAGFFPDYKLLFEHAYIHGPFEMFLMVYYICLFWNNDNDDQLYLITNHIEQLIPMVDGDDKINFVNGMIHKYGKLTLGMDDVAALALLLTDKSVYELREEDEQKFKYDICSMLLKYDIIMNDINTTFYNHYDKEYNDMSS